MTFERPAGASDYFANPSLKRSTNVRPPGPHSSGPTAIPGRTRLPFAANQSIVDTLATLREARAMGFWSKLFGSDEPNPVFASSGTVLASEFAARAVSTHANCSVRIAEVASIVRSLDAALTGKGMNKDTMDDLWHYSLIGLCPKCGVPFGPEALKMSVVFEALGENANVMFSGGSDEAARHRQGLCINASCDSLDVLLFWCPDRDPDALAFFKTKGHELEDCGGRRAGVWPLR